MKTDIERSILELQMRRSELMNEINEINLQITFLEENLKGIENNEELIEGIRSLRQQQSGDDKS